MYSEEKRREIRDLYSKLKSVRKTAKEANVSPDTVHRILNNKTKSTGKPLGPKKVLDNTDRMKKFYISEIQQNKVINSKTVDDNFDFKLSRRTIRRELKDIGFQYGFIDKELPLKKENCLERVEFAKYHIRQNTNFKDVIFSDEKRFSFDGPDNMGSLFYSDNETIIKPRRIKRQMGGGGVMIIGAISSQGNLKIKVIEGSYTSDAYCNDLKKVFIPWCKAEFPGSDWIWQQDNCRIHTTKLVLEIFDDPNLRLLDWPSYSPDLNIIENIWSLMNSFIYSNKQYRGRKELIDAIIDAASKIDKETIKSLFEKFPNRLIKLIENKGERIGY